MSLSKEIAQAQKQIREVAKGYGLDFFEVIFEMVSSDEMTSLAALGGFPQRYPHWRFGMDYDQLSKRESWGLQRIFEMVINADPAYAYLLKANSLLDQKLVIAHVYAHSDFFKNNEFFSKTNRKMLHTMSNHAERVRRYMDRYGVEEVERFADACLSIESMIDPHLPFWNKKGEKKSKTKEDLKVSKLTVNRSYLKSFINPKEFLEKQKEKLKLEKEKKKKIPSSPMRDVLLFLMQHAPLEDWQQDILGMIREESYYFLPQRQTKIMNEGWAAYWHAKILTEKILKDSQIIDFADRHAGAMVLIPGQINPYKIGIEIFRDIEQRWNHGRFGKAWEECEQFQEKNKWDKKLGLGKKKIFEVRKVCNDVTFIDHYLTPELVDRLKLYSYQFNPRTQQYEIISRDFHQVKNKMLSMLANSGDPVIRVKDGNFQNRGELLLEHDHQGMDLDLKWAQETMRALSTLWGRPVCVQTILEGEEKLLVYRSGEFEILKESA